MRPWICSAGSGSSSLSGRFHYRKPPHRCQATSQQTSSVHGRQVEAQAFGSSGANKAKQAKCAHSPVSCAKRSDARRSGDSMVSFAANRDEYRQRADGRQLRRDSMAPREPSKRSRQWSAFAHHQSRRPAVEARQHGSAGSHYSEADNGPRSPHHQSRRPAVEARQHGSPGPIKAKQTMERVRPTTNLDGRQLRRDR